MSSKCSSDSRWVIRYTVNGKRERVYFHSKTLAAHYRKLYGIKAKVYRNTY